MKTRYLPAVKKYIKLLDEIPELIKRSGLKDKYIFEKMGMDRRTWINRKKLKNWRPQEIYEVLKIIEGK
ncbi:hypothetical protein ES702_06173 [subsurface metagenome]